MNPAVLVVDDSLTVRMNLIELLEEADLPALGCSTLAQARQTLAENSFALVILDVLLPDGDGIDLLAEIRGMPETRDTPVMLLSTESEIGNRVRGLTTGADEYVGKPCDPSHVVARARELVRRSTVPQDSAALTVLVIDDSITFREALKTALQDAYYRVVVAASGEDGLRAAANLRPDAIIVDGVLPGMDGAAVIRRVRLDAALRRIPCLLLTGSQERGAEVQALDAGADSFVRKDENISVILARLGATLRGAGERAADRSTTSLAAPKTVLAVDDSETYLQALAAALRADSYEVILARSGEDALELLGVSRVDCILLDLMMPGMGGREMCRRVKSVPALRDTPIVMLTAVDDRDAMIQGLGAGADDYIAKSSDFDLVRARVFAQIRRKHFEDENRHIREQLLGSELEAIEARAARELAETRAALVDELKAKNEELESFSYSVAHDLRAPLRAIDGFGLALLEDYGDRMDETGHEYLRYVREAAQQMARLIDDLLGLARVTREEFRREQVDLSEIARSVVAGLKRAYPEREIDPVIHDRTMRAEGDSRLLAIVFENLIGNAWKYTGKVAQPRIEIGAIDDPCRTYFVRDNGAGFDMAYASKLFGMFQRLHSTAEFEGSGIGLATVQRIIRRHGGRIWAQGEVGRGATFYFTLDGNPRAGIAREASVSAGSHRRVYAGAAR